MQGTGLTFTTSGGARLVYDDEGTGAPVVLIHCYSGRRDYWKLQRPALLGAGYSVIALDQRNHGESDHPTFGRRMARYGQDLRELIDSLDLEDATLVARSFGVSVVLAMFSVSGFHRVGKFAAVDQGPKIVNDGE